MPALAQHFEDRACHLPLPLDGLVRIRVRAERDRVAGVPRLRELPAQEQRGIRLGEELRLEIEARGEIEIGVGRARVAVDAAMLAALVRVDRLRERNVGRGVAADDRPRRLDRDRGLERRSASSPASKPPSNSGAGAAQPSSNASRPSRRKRLPGLNVAPRPLTGGGEPVLTATSVARLRHERGVERDRRVEQPGDRAVGLGVARAAPRTSPRRSSGCAHAW